MKKDQFHSRIYTYRILTWTISNNTVFKEGKCQMLHLGGVTSDMCRGWEIRGWRADQQKRL